LIGVPAALDEILARSNDALSEVPDVDLNLLEILVDYGRNKERADQSPLGKTEKFAKESETDADPRGDITGDVAPEEARGQIVPLEGWVGRASLNLRPDMGGKGGAVDMVSSVHVI
jgi:hypothetical protein